MRSLHALSLSLALAAVPAAQTLTTEPVIIGLNRPVWVGTPPQDDRIFVCEQNTGQIRIFDGSSVLATPFLDIDALTSDTGERGLLGMAFHPKFAQNGFFFVNYTDSSGGDTVIARYRVSDADPNVADPASARILLEVGQPQPNHNAGEIAFGPDGYLYLPMGDGGGGNDPGCRAQDTGELLGKLLRIDVDSGLPYAIPPGNPFGDEIFQLGLRNPFRISFDPLTGDMYIGDVGQGQREEIDFDAAPPTPGRNWGWPVMEGENCRPPNLTNCNNLGVNPPPCFDAAYTDPVHTYVTGNPPGGDGRAVIGGVVYRGCAMPSLQGTYFFADNNSGRYWSFEMVGGVKTNFQARTSELSGAGGRPTDFGYDANGEILISDLINGRVHRIVPVSAPSIADCDGDGQDDPCEIATNPWADLDGSGVVDTCETFSADTEAVCVGAGGVQHWSLHASGGLAGNGYIVFGSLSGTSPGLDLGLGVVVPTNPDTYLLATLTYANNGMPFVQTIGFLDGSAEAEASFAADAGFLAPSFVGLTAAHAYVTFHPASLNPTSASNYTTLSFEP